jgi:hypothetical protein
MILAGLIGSLAATSGGTKTLTLISIAHSPVNEGQQQSIIIQSDNWNNSIIYWRVTDSSNNNLTSQVNTASGAFYGGYGSGQHSVSFTFNADHTTEGPLSYYVKFSSSEGANDILIIGPEICNDTSFAAGGSLVINGSTLSWATTNATVNTYAAYTYPDSTSGSVHTLTGSEYVLSPQFGVAPTLNFNLWFYPTANNTIILGELGQTTENTGWHLTMLELNSSNRLKGRVWEMGDVFPVQVVTSTGAVTLNAWNHVYFYFDNATSTFGMSLNNETPVTQVIYNRHTSSTNHTYWGIGLTDTVTNMGSSARYRGKFDGLVIDSTITGSNYAATKAKYKPSFSLNFPAGNPYLLVSNTQSDWNLGTTYTIEFWSKENDPSTNSIRTVASQGPANGIDLGFMGGGTLFRNTQNPGIPEPGVGGVPITLFNVSSPGGWNTGVNWANLATTGGTGRGLTISVAGAQGGYANAIAIVTPGSGYTSGDVITATGESSVSFTIGSCTPRGLWTHVAFVGNGGNTYVYHNGELKGTYTGPGALGDGSSDLNIGRRAGVNGQGFYGKLAMIRISTTAKYLATFYPSYTYGVEADTKLMLGGTTPLTDLSQAEVLSGVPVYTNGSGNLYILKSLYPDLDTQVQVGDTITAVGNSDSVTTVSASVFLSDPSAWAIPTTDSIYYAANLNITRSRHPISVQGSVTTSPDFPSSQSLVFNQPDSDYLVTAANNDWNLGTTGTIEFWIKANNASNAGIHIPGGQWGLINQGGWYYGMPDNSSILIGLASGNLSIAQSNTGSVEYTEPTAGVWTHVAVVYNAGTQKVYYNGIEQTKVSGNYSGNGWTNTTSDLYIGRLAPNFSSHFDGKMALVRISNTAKYTGAFTATTTYGSESDTKLFLSKLNPTVDSKGHIVVNNGVTTSNDFPVVPASVTITNVSISGNPSPPVTVDFTSTVSATITGTIFFAWAYGDSGPYSITINPGSNTYTSPGISNLNSSGNDFTTQITIASGPDACTSNIFTSAWNVICLVEGTMITLADGSRKAVEDVRYDDLIRVWNFDLGELSEALPVFVKQEETYNKHYRFTFSDGTVLRTVGHHVFNKQAGEFTMLVRDTTPVGTITFNEQGEEVTLIAKETIEETVKFYNVWTQYHLNLFADGILTSNRFNNIYPIRDMKFLKDNRALRPLEEFADIDPKYISGLRLQEQPAQYSAEYIRDYVENKLERLDIANTSKALS